MDDSNTEISTVDERRLQAAADAAERIKRGQHWLDWMDVAEGLGVGRAQAMRMAGTNRPAGSAYNKAFGRWLDQHRWARDLDKPTRAHLFWCLDNRNDLDRWRETLATNERARLNHPTAAKRRYEATHRETIKQEAPRETERDRLLREVERMTAERDAWKRRAEAEGSLFDLKKDRVEDIVGVIADPTVLSDYKFNALVKGLVEAQAGRKRGKQAG